MKNLIFILLSVFIFSSVFTLSNCRIFSQETANSQNIVSNQQTVEEKRLVEEREKKKQGSKLYPYYFDYPIDISVDGEKLNAIFLAIDSFKKDSTISEKKKDLKNYKLDLKQDADFFFVQMTVKRNPDKYYVGGETEDGIDVTFFVSKKDGSVERVFHK